MLKRQKSGINAFLAGDACYSCGCDIFNMRMICFRVSQGPLKRHSLGQALVLFVLFMSVVTFRVCMTVWQFIWICMSVGGGGVGIAFRYVLHMFMIEREFFHYENCIVQG